MTIGQLVISDTTTIERDYDETIKVVAGGKLVVEGQTNRVISVDHGILVVKGVVGRVNSFGGLVIVEEGGYCDSIYCGAVSTIDVKGRVREIYALQNSVVNVYPSANVITCCIDGAAFNIDKDAHIAYFAEVHAYPRSDSHA